MKQSYPLTKFGNVGMIINKPNGPGFISHARDITAPFQTYRQRV
jgi:hypothetical protein